MYNTQECNIFKQAKIYTKNLKTKSISRCTLKIKLKKKIEKTAAGTQCYQQFKKKKNNPSKKNQVCELDKKEEEEGNEIIPTATAASFQFA